MLRNQWTTAATTASGDGCTARAWRSKSLRIRIQKTGELKYDTDLLLDQVRAIANARFLFCYCTVGPNHLKQVDEALRLITGR
jgi:mRNA-degrading endonuclease toxin of MazEF toxin-antitoxin module